MNKLERLSLTSIFLSTQPIISDKGSSLLIVMHLIVINSVALIVILGWKSL